MSRYASVSTNCGPREVFFNYMDSYVFFFFLLFYPVNVKPYGGRGRRRNKVFSVQRETSQTEWI